MSERLPFGICERIRGWASWWAADEDARTPPHAETKRCGGRHGTVVGHWSESEKRKRSSRRRIAHPRVRRDESQTLESDSDDRRHKSHPPLHPSRSRPARGGLAGRRWNASRLRAPLERHHEPRRLGRLQDGRRRDPGGWSQLATDIVVSKYFRKAGLHGDKEHGETSVRQVVLPHRAHHPRGRRAASAATSRPTKDADTFEAELSLPARQPVRRLQLAGVVQLRPLPPATASRAPAATGRGTPRATARVDRDRRTPTSARSARRASSSRSTTT